MKNINEQDLVYSGTVVEAHDTSSLVKVNVLGRITDWLPLLQQANSFKRTFTSVRVGQQVVVLANRYVVGSIFNIDCKEPTNASNDTDITEYEDGTRIEYNSSKSELSIKAVGDITINVVGNTTINTSQAVVKATSVEVDSQDIKLNQGVGVVTGAHICAFTGNPHADCSKTVTAGK